MRDQRKNILRIKIRNGDKERYSARDAAIPSGSGIAPIDLGKRWNHQKY